MYVYSSQKPAVVVLRIIANNVVDAYRCQRDQGKINVRGVEAEVQKQQQIFMLSCILNGMNFIYRLITWACWDD
jgi:hypothetical protein